MGDQFDPEYFKKKLENQQDWAARIGKIAGAFAGFAATSDGDTAACTASNAIDQNFLAMLRVIVKAIPKLAKKTPGVSKPLLKDAKHLEKGKEKVKNASSSKPHGNSNDYEGNTHVYEIKNLETGKPFKVGESMQGVNRFGQSKRAQQQARRLERKTGVEHKTKIRREFYTKAEAREYETKLIERARSMRGKGCLPGNKGNR